MDAMRQIEELIEKRSEELSKQKEKGKKIVGIVGLGYTPEELIYAAGAIPQRLLRGGDPAAIDDSRQYSHNCFSTFHKAQIGYLMKGRDQVYTFPDYLVFESGDEHSELAGMHVYSFKETPTTWLGVPGNPDFSDAFPYYLKALSKFKEELESLTGEKVSDERLREYISVYNEIREILKNVAMLRKSDTPPLSGLDFVKLNHASFYCDPHKYVGLLRTVYNELKEKKIDYAENLPRVAVFGCPIGVGDYALLELIESVGAVVVTEELSGSIRCFEKQTEENQKPMKSLAERYYSKKRIDAYCYPWGEELIHLFTGLAGDFKVNGVIWYQLMYMACHSMLGYKIEKQIKKMKIPLTTIHSEYDFESRLEAVKTRIETFIEIIKG